ncbi:MAG: hypothetical protein JXB49_06850 [Bacteroidales bacterium]|nr:hypothetical protein [Bacteroidales bacterium]
MGEYLKYNLLFYLLIGIPYTPFWLTSIAQNGVYLIESNENDSSSTYSSIKAITITNKHDIILVSNYINNRNTVHSCQLIKLNSRLEKIADLSFGSAEIINLYKPLILPDNSIQLFCTASKHGFFNPVVYSIEQNLDAFDEKDIYTNQSTYIGGIVEVDSQNIIIVQSVKDESNTYNINIFQFNTKTNQEIWSNRVISELHELPSNIILLKDYSIVVLAKRYDHSFSSYSPIIYRLSPVGEKIWLKDMTSTIHGFHTHDIIQSDNNNLIYISSYQGRNNQIPQTLLVSINIENGNTIQKEVIDTLKANGIIQLSNGNFLIYGSQNPSFNNPSHSIASYVLISREFKQIYSYELNSLNFVNNKASEIKKSSISQGSEILTGTRLFNNSIILGGNILLINNDKNENSQSKEIKQYVLMFYTDYAGFIQNN